VAFYANDTGIFAMESALVLPPPPDRPSFSTIVADALAPVPGLSAQADGSSADLGSVNPNGISDAFDAQLGGTADAAEVASNATAGTTAGDLVDNGSVVDAREAQVKPYLPGPDTGVQVNFQDPPQLGEGAQGNYTGPPSNGEPSPGGGNI
jgi:hypothetical protein